MTTKADLEKYMLQRLAEALPATICTEVRSRESSDVSPGFIRLVLEYPRSGAAQYPVLNSTLPATVVSWNAGAREHDILSELYAAALVEPHVTWASDLGWRVTEAGKKAGLK